MSRRSQLHSILSQHAGNIDRYLTKYQERYNDGDRTKEFCREFALLHRTTGYIYYCLGTEEARGKARSHYDEANLLGYCEAYPTDVLFHRQRIELQPNYPRIYRFQETARKVSVLLFRVPTFKAVTLAALMASLVIASPFWFDWKPIIAPLHRQNGVSPLGLMFGAFAVLDTAALVALSWRRSARRVTTRANS
jgi:hypothetical protein